MEKYGKIPFSIKIKTFSMFILYFLEQINKRASNNKYYQLWWRIKYILTSTKWIFSKNVHFFLQMYTIINVRPSVRTYVRTHVHGHMSGPTLKKSQNIHLLTKIFRDFDIYGEIFLIFRKKLTFFRKIVQFLAKIMYSIFPHFPIFSRVIPNGNFPLRNFKYRT